MDEANSIRDEAVAIQSFARQAKDSDMERWVAESMLRARRRIGELSKGLETAPGVNLPYFPRSAHTGKPETLAAAVLSKTETHWREQKVASRKLRYLCRQVKRYELVTDGICYRSQ